MSSDTQHLIDELVGLCTRIETVERKVTRTEAGLIVPTREDWNQYAKVNKELAEIKERLDKLAGMVEMTWEMMEANSGQDRAGNLALGGA